MSFYHQFAKVILPFGDWVLGSSFTKHLNELRKVESLSDAQLLELQQKKLDRLLQHAIKNSAYYGSLNMPGRSDPFELVKCFPILTKAALRQNANGLLTRPARELFRHSSSGSTGFQSTVYWSRDELDVNRATQLLWWHWAGYELGDPIVQTGINPNRTLVKSVKDLLLRTYYLKSFSHSETEVLKALSWAKGKKRPMLGGYASSLYVMSKIASANDFDVSFQTAVSWGDKLFDHYRRGIEHTFNTKVYETYASAEGLMMAAQADLDFMYIMSSNVYLEIVDDVGKEVKDGEMGHVLVTNLNAYAMPLIRYKIGDLAIKLPREKYPTKRKFKFPLLQKVIGRDTDIVKTRSGKFMVVHGFTGIFEHIPEIEQFCVVQDTIDSISIEYVPSNNFRPSVLELIEDKITKSVDGELKIVFTEVSQIARTKSGKPQIIISNLGK